MADALRCAKESNTSTDTYTYHSLQRRLGLLCRTDRILISIGSCIMYSVVAVAYYLTSVSNAILQIQ